MVIPRYSQALREPVMYVGSGCSNCGATNHNWRDCFLPYEEESIEPGIYPDMDQVYIERVENLTKRMDKMQKTLHNSTVSAARDNVKDIKVVGNGDSFRLLCKASSEAEGWMKSTKAYQIEDSGCIVQVSTQQRNPDGSYAVAEAVTFVPQVKIAEDENGGRKLISAIDVQSSLELIQSLFGGQNIGDSNEDIGENLTLLHLMNALRNNKQETEEENLK